MADESSQIESLLVLDLFRLEGVEGAGVIEARPPAFLVGEVASDGFGPVALESSRELWKPRMGLLVPRVDVPQEAKSSSRPQHACELLQRAIGVKPVKRLRNERSIDRRGWERKGLGPCRESLNIGQALRELLAHGRNGLNSDYPARATDK